MSEKKKKETENEEVEEITAEVQEQLSNNKGEDDE